MPKQEKTLLAIPKQSSFTILTAAALALPGLLPTTANSADGDSIDFQYSHYQEGKRDADIPTTLYDAATQSYKSDKAKNYRNPIEVDSIHGSARISLTDRIKFSFNYLEDTWSGATPLATTGKHDLVVRNIGDDKNGNPILVTGATPLGGVLDKNGNRLYSVIDPATGKASYLKDEMVHIMSYASPETRKQGDFKLSYAWDEAALDVGGGISIERDYESRFVNLGGRMDFNQKQTTANLGLSYTNSDINAAVNFGGVDNLNATRQDWATHLGLTQVINKDALLELNMSYTRSTGYMANPYKASALYYRLISYGLPDGISPIASNLYLEQRPEVRNQWNWNARWVQYVQLLDAALHLDYQFAHDDWGINAHTFAADWVQPLGEGWTVTPRIRYYSQEAADFYGTSFEVKPKVTEYAPGLYNYEITKKPDYFSSDHRLSGYGTLSGGLMVSKAFAKGIKLETGIEYYTHQGDLKLGGSGEGSYADFDFWVANAALKVNLDSIGQGGSGNDHLHTKHDGHPNIPAGVLFGHTLEKSGDMMVGYRFMHSQQAGDFLHGDGAVSELQAATNGCPGSVHLGESGFKADSSCTLLPKEMTMNMHMLDIMYAPTDWLTLMLMPQFVDMQMPVYQPESVISTGHTHGGGHTGHDHVTGGIGDTGMYALVKLFDTSTHQIHTSLGFTAPTGDVGIKVKEGSHQNNANAKYNLDGPYTHYGMQLGSGTWDFKPSLTYSGKADAWSWGGQVGGTLRLEDANSSGYALGDLFETSVWGGYDLTHWLSASVRVAYAWQGIIKNHYPDGRRPNRLKCILADYTYADDLNGDGIPDGPPFLHQADYDQCLISAENIKLSQDTLDRPSPMDTPSNYGGHYVDVGFGLSATVPSGSLAGNRLAFEWLQPVYTDVNGYQLDRDGALSFTWSYGF